MATTLNSTTVASRPAPTGEGRVQGPKSRQKLINAAVDLFGTRGFGRTSIDDILKTARVTKSNFYYHFASKDALGTEAIKRMQDSMQQTVWPETLRNRELPPLERISRFVQVVAEALAANNCQGGCPFGNLAIELSDDWPSFRTQLARFFQTLVHEIAACLTEAQEVGQIRADLDPQMTAQLLLTQFEGSMLLAKTYKDVTPIHQSLSTVAHMIQS